MTNSLDALKQHVESTDKQQEHNPLLDKLIQKQSKDGKELSTLDKRKAGKAAFAKVMNMRYKIYVGLLLFIVYTVRNSFLGPMMTEHKRLNTSLSDKETQTLQLESKLNRYKQDKSFTDLIEQQENNNAIYQCINNELDCDKLPSTIADSMDVVKAYLQIGNLYDKKMIIDEKSLLINLDAFMTKDWVNGFPTERSNGEILNIDIGEPSQIDQQLYEVPVDIIVKFYDKNGLISFVNNIENRIVRGIDAGILRSTPVLYIINELIYDIVKYQEEQEVKITVTAYYYQEDRVDVFLDGDGSAVSSLTVIDDNTDGETSTIEVIATGGQLSGNAVTAHLSGSESSIKNAERLRLLEETLGDCDLFAEKLQSCEAYTCNYKSPIQLIPEKVESLQREIVGAGEDSSCIYQEQLPGDSTMKCQLNAQDRIALATLHQRIQNAVSINQKATVAGSVEVGVNQDGKVLVEEDGWDVQQTMKIDGDELENTLDRLLKEGICQIVLESGEVLGVGEEWEGEARADTGTILPADEVPSPPNTEPTSNFFQ